MDENHVSPTTLSTDNAAPDEGQAGPPAAVPPGQEGVASPSRWTAGRIIALVIGVILVLISLGLLASGGTALWADRTQREAGYVTTDVHEFSTSGSALATEPTDFGSAGTGWLYAPGLLDKVRIRVTPANTGSSLFVGIGRSADVDRYLAGVNHTLISDFWDEKVQAIGGGAPASAPGAQDFWVASATGPGAQSLVWEPADGSWTVVVMNADGRPAIDIAADLGARLPSLLWIAVGFLAAGGVIAVGGVLLIVGAVRRRQPDKDVVRAT